MEIKYAQTTGSRQLILVGPRSTANNNDPLIFLYFEESTNKMYIHFWRDGADFQPYVPTNVSKSEFFTWNKKGVHSSSKLHGQCRHLCNYSSNRFRICYRFPLKLQLIQSTSDGLNCKQEVKIAEKTVWEETVNCPKMLTGTKGIWLFGDVSWTPFPDAQIRNFQFLTHPL